MRFILILVLQVFALLASAEQDGDDIINKIEVIGNKRTESSTIISYSEFSKGDKYTAQASETALKRLYITGFFSEVKLNFSHQTLQIVVEENPIINEIKFRGNDSMKNELLQAELSLNPRMFLSKARLQNDVNRIIELYDRSGKYFTVVTPKIAKLPQNRVNILFDIKERAKIKIKKISFVGNEVFSSGTLRSVIMSKEDRIYNIFRPNYYNPDMVEHDKMLLTQFYTQNGYAEVKMISAVAELLPGEEGFYLTFTVEEGSRYKFGDVITTNHIKKISQKDIDSKISFKQGQIFNSERVENSVNDIIKHLANSGFPFVKIVPDYKVNQKDKTVNVIFEISESPKIYVGRISIGGNLKTYDYVIRREMRVVEGDPYNAFLINRSEQRLRNLDYFEKVSITTQPTARKDVVDLKIEVQEKSTASVKFSAGYSTTEGPLGMVSFEERNLLGRGQRFHAKVQKSAVSTHIGSGITQPNFMDTAVDAGVALSYTTENNKKTSFAEHNSKAFNSDTKYGTVFVAYDITENLSHTIGYSITQERVKSIGNDVPAIVKAQRGNNVISALSHDLDYNVTDNSIKPTAGYTVGLGQSVAGLGGTSKYLRNILKGNYYYQIWNQVILRIGGNVGYMHNLGRDIRVSDNFYLGDYTFRGFESAGIGPRDIKSGDALGGKIYYKGTVETSFPIPGVPKDLDLSGAVFSDFGSLWSLDVPKNIGYSNANYYDKKSMRVSAGAGLVLVTAMGPLRIDFAKAIKKEKYDITKVFLLSFATAL